MKEPKVEQHTVVSRVGEGKMLGIAFDKQNPGVHFRRNRHHFFCEVNSGRNGSPFARRRRDVAGTTG